MKKFLASLLAVSMIAGMSATSFAYQVENGTPDDLSVNEAFESMIKEKDGKFYYDDEDGYPIADVLVGPFGYDAEDKYLTTDVSIEFGKTAYYFLTSRTLEGEANEANYTDENKSTAADASDILDAAKVKFVTNSDTVSGLKIKTDLEEGEDLIDGITVTKKKISDVGRYEHEVGDTGEDEWIPDSTEGSAALNLLKGYGFEEDKYYYMIALSIEDSSSVSDADIIGSFILSKTGKPKCDDISFDFAINVDWEYSYRNDTSADQELTITGDFEPVLADKYYALKFDCDEEVEFTFEDDSTFTVDVSGQPKTLVYYDTEYNSRVASRYPLAELNFWNGNGAKFNRTGEFFLAVGEDAEDYAQFLYQVNSDGTLSEVPGAEYDDSDGGFYFKTRTLGSYVYSDMDLSDEIEEDENDDIVVTPDDSVVSPVVPVNPGTGARA